METLIIRNLKKVTQEGFELSVKTLKLEKGKIYGLVGPNGAGKTTLMKCLSGLLGYDGGQIEMQKQMIQIQAEEIMSRIGTNFINLDSLNEFTLLQIYQEHIFYYGVQHPIELNALLRDVELSVQKKYQFGKMSLGMKQRFLLGITFLHSPDLIIFDEPFNGLDPDGVSLFISKLRKMSKKCIILISDHGLNQLASFIDEVLFIENGSIQKSVPISKINMMYKGGLNEYYDQKKASRSSTT